MTPQPEAAPVDGEAPSLAWKIEEMDTGTKPALALTSDGVPYVAYMLEAMPGFVKNTIRNGSSWDITTVADGYFYGPLDIAIGPDDAAHITYHDHQDPGQFSPELGDAAHAVLTAAGGDWDVETVFDGGHDRWDNRLTVDALGRPHMSAIEPPEFGPSGVEYYTQNGAGEWTVESIGSGPLTYKYSTSIAVDPSGNPHITYYDQNKKDLALGSRGGSGWNITTVDGQGDTGLFSSLVIDAEARFHISYLQRESGSSGPVKYATRGPDDSAWTLRPVDSLAKLAFGFIGAGNITSVAVDAKGNPWIAYSDERSLRVAIWTWSEWRVESVVEGGSRKLGQLVSLELKSQSIPTSRTSRSPGIGRLAA